MADDMFLKLDDIKGESQDKAHKDEIEVLTWSWGMSQSGTAHSGTGAGAGRVAVQDLTIEKYVDKSSPSLIKQCCTGKHFGIAKLTIRKAGGNPIEYLKIELKDGLIAAVTTGGPSKDERVKETVTLNFASFKYEYTPQTASGAGGAVIPAQWHIAKNAES